MFGTVVPLFPGVPGGPELLVILLIATLLFGANKIPKLARSTGQALGEFQKGRQEVEQELQELREGDIESEGAGADRTTAADSTETRSGSSTDSVSSES